jgi:hypothetical protein
MGNALSLKACAIMSPFDKLRANGEKAEIAGKNRSC